METVNIDVVEVAPAVQITVAEPNSIVAGEIQETAQATIETPASVESNKYVSVRRFWQGLTKQMSLAWTWLEKQTYSKGINAGNNASPSANGDFWFNSSASAFQGRIGGVIYNLLTSLNGKVGRVLFVSKDGNDTTAIVGSQIFTYLTIQAAWNNSLPEDTIIVYNGIYTENLALGGSNPNRTIILINATINGTVSNIFTNSVNYGRLVGLGKSVVTGFIDINGTGTGFEVIKNITANFLPKSGRDTLYNDCTFTISVEGFMRGTYENCTFTSSVGLIAGYGASSGFNLFNCRISCTNFTVQSGGIDGGVGGQYVIQNCRISCTNFFSTRIASVVLQITDSTIKASGSTYFLFSDIGIAFKVNIMNSVLQTACANLDQNTLNANSIIYAISNKGASGTYLVMPTVISSLTLI